MVLHQDLALLRSCSLFFYYSSFLVLLLFLLFLFFSYCYAVWYSVHASGEHGGTGHTHHCCVYAPRGQHRYLLRRWRRGGDTQIHRKCSKAWEDLRPQSDKEKVNLIYGKIGDEVEAELDCQLEGRIPSPQEVLKILERCYGEKRSVPALQRLFFSNKQRRCEDIRTYSHRIKAAFDAVVKKQQDTSTTVSQPCELRDTFLENIRDRQMKRQLRQMLSNSPNSSFNELRIQAMRWEEEDSEEEEEKPIRQVSASPATDTTANAIKALTDQLSKLTTLVQDQQHQLEQVRSRGTVNGPATTERSPEGPASPQYPTQAEKR